MMFPINDSVIGACLREFGEFSENENILLGNFIKRKETCVYLDRCNKKIDSCNYEKIKYINKNEHKYLCIN